MDPERTRSEALTSDAGVWRGAGEHPLVITFNLMVAISSLLYLVRLRARSTREAARRSQSVACASGEARLDSSRLGPLGRAGPAASAIHTH